MTKIKSPINGTVESVGIKIGQSVSPGMPVFRVINFKSVKVVAEISEFYSSKVNDGDEVEIDFPDLDKKIQAKITSASKYINPQNRTFEIEVKLNPENNHFKANMVAVVRINDYKAENAMVVPINLIQNDSQGDYRDARRPGKFGSRREKDHDHEGAELQRAGGNHQRSQTRR